MMQTSALTNKTCTACFSPRERSFLAHYGPIQQLFEVFQPLFTLTELAFGSHHSFGQISHEVHLVSHGFHNPRFAPFQRFVIANWDRNGGVSYFQQVQVMIKIFFHSSKNFLHTLFRFIVVALNLQVPIQNKK